MCTMSVKVAAEGVESWRKPPVPVLSSEGSKPLIYLPSSEKKKSLSWSLVGNLSLPNYVPY